MGNHNRVTGSHNTVTGNHNHIDGNKNVVTGNHNKIDGKDNKITGNHNKVQGHGNTATGTFNKINGEEQRSSGSVVRVGGITILGSIKSGGDVIINSNKRPAEEVEEQFVECPLESDKDEEAAENAPSCVLCMTNVPACIILPCLHKSVCCACARVLAGEGLKKRGEVTCPICRKDVEKIAKVFE